MGIRAPLRSLDGSDPDLPVLTARDVRGKEFGRSGLP